MQVKLQKKVKKLQRNMREKLMKSKDYSLNIIFLSIFIKAF